MNNIVNILFFQKKRLLFLILLYFIIVYLKKIGEIKSIKVCLCTIGKNENNYVIEFIEHYKKYSFDKIFIYDNNDLEGERFENILNYYIKDKFVEIINYRGKNKNQLKSMNDCYQKNFLKYDWLLFCDMDEFIYLKEQNIKRFLFSGKFKSCDRI